jgi:hypothetical protein
VDGWLVQHVLVVTLAMIGRLAAHRKAPTNGEVRWRGKALPLPRHDSSALEPCSSLSVSPVFTSTLQDLHSEFFILPLCPRYINISNHPIQCTSWGVAQPNPKVKTNKGRKTNANTGRLIKTMMTRNRCALQRSTTTLLAGRDATYQATPSPRKRR